MAPLPSRHRREQLLHRQQVGDERCQPIGVRRPCAARGLDQRAPLGGPDRLGVPPVRRLCGRHHHPVQPGDRRADGRGVQHRVRVVDVCPRLQAQGLSVHVGDVAAVAVGQRTRTRHAGVVAAGLEAAVSSASSTSSSPNVSLTRENPAGGDETAYLTLLTPCRFDLSRASGPRSKRSATWAAIDGPRAHGDGGAASPASGGIPRRCSWPGMVRELR